VRPITREEDTPVARRTTMVDLRTQELCDLWKRALRNHDKEDGKAAIEQFFIHEKQLINNWETARRLKREEPLQRAARLYEFAERTLRSIERAAAAAAGGLAQHHPMFDGFYNAVAEDARVLLERLPSRRDAALKP